MSSLFVICYDQLNFYICSICDHLPFIIVISLHLPCQLLQISVFLPVISASMAFSSNNFLQLDKIFYFVKN